MWSTVNFEWSPTFDISSFVILGQCSYLGRSSLPPFEMIYHTHLIYLLYIAGKSWIIVISSLLPLQSDFLWFLIIFRAQQKWFLETLNVFYFSSLLGIKTSCVDLKLPIALRLITNLNLLACQTLLWSPYLASHQMSRIFVNCVNFYTSSESLNLSSWLASCPSHSETCFSSNFKSNTQQRSKKIFLN